MLPPEALSVIDETVAPPLLFARASNARTSRLPAVVADGVTVIVVALADCEMSWTTLGGEPADVVVVIVVVLLLELELETLEVVEVVVVEAAAPENNWQVTGSTTCVRGVPHGNSKPAFSQTDGSDASGYPQFPLGEPVE